MAFFSPTLAGVSSTVRASAALFAERRRAIAVAASTRHATSLHCLSSLIASPWSSSRSASACSARSSVKRSCFWPISPHSTKSCSWLQMAFAWSIRTPGEPYTVERSVRAASICSWLVPSGRVCADAKGAMKRARDIPSIPNVPSDRLILGFEGVEDLLHLIEGICLDTLERVNRLKRVRLFCRLFNRLASGFILEALNIGLGLGIARVVAKGAVPKKVRGYAHPHDEAQPCLVTSLILHSASAFRGLRRQHARGRRRSGA